MASEEIHMATPICLIENKPNGKLLVNVTAAKILERIHQPVVVVAIVGLYRTGKSYLMNRLADKKSGFSLGATVQALTKGIWMWCLPHPRRPDLTLVLLDTEGLGDVQKGNSQNDSWIFALAILLSSTLVYNSKGTIDQDALEKLHYVTELTKKIRAKSSFEEHQELENSAEFVRFFPDFIWAVRDFTLQLEIDGKPITEDEYLESALKLDHDNTDKSEKCNMPRLCIRKYFPSRKCFTFEIPTSRKNLPQLETLDDEKLATDFVEEVNNFCKYIWNTARLKTVPGSHIVNGTMLMNLVKTFVDAINNGCVPCLENSVSALSEIENSAALTAVVSYYEEQMMQRLMLPTGTEEELLGVHTECEREATRSFFIRAFGDSTEKYQAELVQRLQQKKEEFCKKNEQASSDRCQALIRRLSQELEDGILSEIYCVPGGYQHFQDKLNEIKEKYSSKPGKGIQADKVLEEFLKSKEMVANSVLQMDKALSEKEKEIEAKRIEAETAQQQQKVLEQEQARVKQMIEDEKRSYEEQLQVLQQKIEEEKKKMEEETEKMIEHKMKEREELLKEGFEQKSRELEIEIQHLKEEKTKNTTAAMVSTVGKLLSLALPLMKELLLSDDDYDGERGRFRPALTYRESQLVPGRNRYLMYDSDTDDEID